MIGALCVFFLAPWLAAIRHSPAVVPLLQLMSPMVPLMTMQIIWINGLQGFKEFRWRVLVQRILIPIILILLLLGTILLFHPTKDNLQPIALTLLINTAIGTVLSLFFFFRKVASVVKSETEEYRLHDWFGFAVPNFLTSIIDTVLESVDTLLLAYFAVSNAGIGQYAAAIKISGFILMPQASFNAMFAPTIAELHSKGEQQKLEAMFKVVTKWAITFSLPIFGIGTLFSSSLLAISGERFVSAWPLVIAFCIGTMINVSTGSVGYMLLMTGHQKISFLNSLTAVTVNVVVGIILTPHYGAMGVAIATGMAVSVVNLMRLLQVRILVKMQPFRWDVVKPLLAWLLSSLFTGMLLYLFNLLHLSAVQLFGFHFELCLIPVFLAIYVGLLALFKVSPEDQVVLDMLRRKFLRGKKNRKNKKR
jgi:O-antigen/teichoic acid export membrane protein